MHNSMNIEVKRGIQEWSKGIQNIRDKITAPDVKVVAFDIFDTLLLRPVTSPGEVFTLVGQVAGVEFFRNKRTVAEAEARKYKKSANDDDIVIEQIYEMYGELFHADNTECERLMALELQVEYDICYARQSVKYLYSCALSAGKEIVIVSDMYLHSDFLKKMLKKCGYEGYSKLYVSGELKDSKSTGNLWNRVINDCAEKRIATSEIFTIGDNSNSDCKIPVRKGTQTSCIPKAIDKFVECAYLDEYKKMCLGGLRETQFNMLIGLVANSFFDDPFIPFNKKSRYNGNPNLLGYLVAPMFLTCSLWLFREAESDGVEQLILAYRDGYMINEIKDIIEKYIGQLPFEVSPVYFSRILRTPSLTENANGLFENTLMSAPLASLSVRAYVKNQLLLEDCDAKKAYKIFARYGFTNPNSEIGNIATNPELIADLHELMSSIQSINNKTELYKKYLSNIIADKKIGLFDSGRRSRSVRFLYDLFSIKSVSYELMKETTTFWNKDFQRKGFITEDIPERNLTRGAIIRFIEQVMSNPCTEVIGINELNGHPEIELDIIDTESVKLIQTIQRTILDYTDMFCSLLSKYIDFITIDNKKSYYLLFDLMDRPNQCDADVLKKFEFENWTVPDANAQWSDWYDIHFKRKPASTPSIKNKPLKECIRVWGYMTAEKLHILDPARRMYHILSGKSNLQPIDIAIKTIVDNFIEKLSSDETLVLSPSENVVFFADNINPAARTFFNSYIRSEPTRDVLHFGSESEARNKWWRCAEISIPSVFNRITNGFANYNVNIKLPQNVKDFFVEHPTYSEIVTLMRIGYPSFYPGKSSEVLVYEMYKLYSAVLDLIKPSVVQVWNAFVPRVNMLINVAEERGIPVIVHETGLLPGTVFADSFGINGRSAVARNAVAFRAMPVSGEEIKEARKLISDWNESNANRYRQIKSAQITEILESIDKSKPTIFVVGEGFPESGLGTVWSDSREYACPTFDSNCDALEYIAKLGEQNNWNVIYKPHPLTLTQLKDNDHFQMPKNVIYIESGDMYDVFKVSDVVITIVSAVSYSALIKNIPVVQLGYQCLHGQDCAYDALSFEAIEPVIKQALKDGRTDEQKANFERHCAQLLKYYLFDDMQPNHTRYGLQPEKVVELMDIVIDGKTTEDFIFRT